MFKRLLLLSLVFCSLFILTRQNSDSLLTGNQNQKNIFVSKESRGAVLGDKTDNEPVFAALPSFDQQMKTSIKIDDARPEIVRQYLAKYNSPLEPLAQLIVDLSDQHDFDYRWMVAIAQQESNLCKRIPPDSHNCWGWGIYGDKVTRFDSFEEAMRRIAPQFVTIFLKGDHTREPMEVMKTYTPPSTGSWANGVSTFFRHLE
jgi:hypothetical protein